MKSGGIFLPHGTFDHYYEYAMMQSKQFFEQQLKNSYYENRNKGGNTHSG